MAASPDITGRTSSTTSSEAYVATWRRRLDEELQALVPNKEPRELYEPVRYVLGGGGKRLRPLIVLLTCEAFDVSPKAALPAALAVETFHAFTLVHDDIMDHAATRRGRPSVHAKWDESTAILAGDYLMALSYRLLSSLDSQGVFHEMVARLCEGQALDKAFETRDEVSLREYLHMIDCKTGALLKASFQLGGIAAKAAAEKIDKLGAIGADLGRAFQIQDDLLDVTADDDRWGKPVGADLLEGKKTYLLLTALERAEGGEREWFRRIIIQEGLQAEDIQEAKERMQRLGVLESARETSHKLMQHALERLEDMELSGGADALFRLLHRTKQRIY